jgi:signal transduction histidine kinase
MTADGARCDGGTVTEADQHEELELLRRQVQIYKDIFRCLPFGLIFVDDGDRVAMVNPLGEEIRCVGDRKGGPVADCHPQGTHPMLRKVLERFRDTPPEEQHPIVLERMNRYEVTYARVSGEDGSYRGVLWASYDVSRRKMLERELVHAERLAGLGRMASKVAHDIKNPLNAIQGAAHHLEQVNGEGEVGELSVLVKEQVAKIAVLLDRVKELTRPLRSRMESTDLVELVEAQIRGLKLAHPATVWSVEAESRLPAIPCDPSLVERLVSNAAENAVQAMDGGGAVRIAMGLDSHPDGSSVVLRVEDTGPGFPTDVLEHLFEPFVTTRPEGTGLGLTIMREICLLHGGDLTVRNTASGAVVTARLSA